MWNFVLKQWASSTATITFPFTSVHLLHPQEQRSVSCTCVATNMGVSMWAHLVTRHMPHSANTEEQYYQAIVGDRHAMEAYGTMTALREGDSGETEMNSMHSGDDMAGTSPHVQARTSRLQKCWLYSDEETQLVQILFAKEIYRGKSVRIFSTSTQWSIALKRT